MTNKELYNYIENYIKNEITDTCDYYDGDNTFKARAWWYVNEIKYIIYDDLSEQITENQFNNICWKAVVNLLGDSIRFDMKESENE